MTRGAISKRHLGLTGSELRSLDPARVTFPDQKVLDSEAIGRIVRRMASEVVERTRGTKHLGLVGIRRGGVPIARRLADEIWKAEGLTVPVGELDITLYRDDAATGLLDPLLDPKVGPSHIEFTVQDADVVLVDDVLHTGRTVRAAIDCLFDYGRPRRIWLAALCDRGDRQLPIAADFVGRTFEVPPGYAIDVVSGDAAGDDAVLLRRTRASILPAIPSIPRGGV